MPERRATNYIERLPEIIDRDEGDISHLDPEMVEILYPERAPKEFRIDLLFQAPSAHATEEQRQRYRRAVPLAERGPNYRAQGSGDRLTHRVSFSADEANQLHELFSLVGELPSCEVLVRGKRVPFARELWLPFFWFFRKDEE